MKNKINLYELKKSFANFERKSIKQSSDAAAYIRQFYLDDLEIFESSFILLLNRANITIGYVKLSQGGICGTIMDIKLICKYAVDALASSVIIAHNHPSGNLNPSNADIEITNKIKAALNIVDSQLIEHIILTAESYYSFADNGKI
jgi:DNA repair protein RadC